jgi:hypothetical protein
MSQSGFPNSDLAMSPQVDVSYQWMRFFCDDDEKLKVPCSTLFCFNPTVADQRRAVLVSDVMWLAAGVCVEAVLLLLLFTARSDAGAATRMQTLEESYGPGPVRAGNKMTTGEAKAMLIETLQPIIARHQKVTGRPRQSTRLLLDWPAIRGGACGS